MSESGGYHKIFQSTVLIGGSSLIGSLIGMIRIKAVAILLGPNGIGLLGIYGNILGMIVQFSSFGIFSSGVRQIARAAASGREDDLSVTVKTYRVLVWGTGIFGCGLMALLCVPLSRWSFKSDAYALPIAILSLGLLLSALTSGQTVLLQGLRKVRDLALINICSALTITVVSIPFYYFWGTAGIVPALLTASVGGLLTSWLFTRRVRISSILLSWQKFHCEARSIVSLGLGFMVAGSCSITGTYLGNVVITRQLGLEAYGIFQAAYAMSGMLVNLVLNALGMDYYPKLCGLLHDRSRMREAVAQQIEISLLLAAPGLLLMLLAAPILIPLFYSAKFAAAVPLLRIFAIGVLVQVAVWPMLSIISAHGDSRILAFMEGGRALLYVVALLLGTAWGGVNGSAIGFAVMYIVYLLLMMVLSGIRYRIFPGYRNLLLLAGICGVMLLMLGIDFLPLPLWGILTGKFLLGGAAILGCVRTLMFRLEVPLTRPWLILKVLKGGKKPAVQEAPCSGMDPRFSENGEAQ